MMIAALSTILLCSLPTWAQPPNVQGGCTLTIYTEGNARIKQGSSELPSQSWRAADFVFDQTSFDAHIPSIQANPPCGINGTTTQSSLRFDLRDKADYLYKCGEVSGVTITYTNPEALAIGTHRPILYPHLEGQKLVESLWTSIGDVTVVNLPCDGARTLYIPLQANLPAAEA